MALQVKRKKSCTRMACQIRMLKFVLATDKLLQALFVSEIRLLVVIARVASEGKSGVLAAIEVLLRAIETRMLTWTKNIKSNEENFPIISIAQHNGIIYFNTIVIWQMNHWIPLILEKKARIEFISIYRTMNAKWIVKFLLVSQMFYDSIFECYFKLILLN